MLAIFKELITVGARALVRAIVGEIHGDDDDPKAEATHPTYADVKRMQDQQASSVALSMAAAAAMQEQQASSVAASMAAAAARRRAITTPPPACTKSDTLPSTEDIADGKRSTKGSSS